jgi:NifU-like protein involved in Fe-S cluster formation
MQRDVYHYFQQACRRKLESHYEPLRFVKDGDATAGFAIRLGDQGSIEEVQYRCTTCMTLIALCEHVAEEIRGATPDRARELTAAGILRRHPEIPVSRHSRAILATAAVHAALETLPI